MNIDHVEALAELIIEPDVIQFFDGCGKYTLAEVEELLHGQVRIQGC